MIFAIIHEIKENCGAKADFMVGMDARAAIVAVAGWD